MEVDTTAPNYVVVNGHACEIMPPIQEQILGEVFTTVKNLSNPFALLTYKTKARLDFTRNIFYEGSAAKSRNLCDTLLKYTPVRQKLMHNITAVCSASTIPAFILQRLPENTPEYDVPKEAMEVLKE